MTSGAKWPITPQDILITFSLLLLFIEIFKASRSSSSRGIIDHMLSMGLFVVMLIEFLLLRAGGDVDLLPADDDQPGRRARRVHHHGPGRAPRRRDRGSRCVPAIAVDARTGSRFSPPTKTVPAHDPRFSPARPLAGHRARRAWRRPRIRWRRQAAIEALHAGGSAADAAVTARRGAVRGRAAHDRHRRRLLLPGGASRTRRCGATTAPAARRRASPAETLLAQGIRAIGPEFHSRRHGAGRGRGLGSDPHGARTVRSRSRAAAGDPLRRARLPGGAARRLRLGEGGARLAADPGAARHYLFDGARARRSAT